LLEVVDGPVWIYPLGDCPLGGNGGESVDDEDGAIHVAGEARVSAKL
jgi:hypothetical protein